MSFADYEKGVLDLKVFKQKGLLCCPKVKVLGPKGLIEVYGFSIDETLTMMSGGKIIPLSSESIVSHPGLTAEVDK